jgi:hypothetical protein
MTGDHHGQTARRATLLVRAADEILGTHSRYKTRKHGEATRLTPLTKVVFWLMPVPP